MSEEIDVKSIRERLGESQAQFAKRFEVTQNAVWFWEHRGVPKNKLFRRELMRLQSMLSRENSE